MIFKLIMDPKQTKTSRTQSTLDSDSDNEIRIQTMSWPPFLLVESGDEALPIPTLSPFVVDKGFQALITGRLRSIRQPRNTDFLLEC